MPTFQKTETVDARQFVGGLQDGSNLVLWVNSNGQLTETRAHYEERITGYTTGVDSDGSGKLKETKAPYTRPEHLRIRTYAFRTDVYVGDWIILKQDGHFDVMRPQEFEAAGYKQV